MNSSIREALKASLLLATLALCLAGCGSSDNPADAGVSDAGTEPPCSMNPTTHLEIINACTTAEPVDKQPVLPLLNADGTLPPLR